MKNNKGKLFWFPRRGEFHVDEITTSLLPFGRTSKLLEEYANRILLHLNLPRDGNLSLRDFEPLGKIAPSLPDGFLSENSAKHEKNKSLVTSIGLDGSIFNGGSIEYTNEEMTKAFWNTYAATVDAEIRSRMLAYIR